MRGSRILGSRVPKLEPSEATHIRAQRRGRAFALTACSKRHRLSLRAALLRHIMPSPFLCLRLRSPKYLAFLLTLKSDRYTKLAFSYPGSSWYLSIPDPLCYYCSPPFLNGEPELSSKLLRAGLGREALRTIRQASTGNKSRENFRKGRSVITVEL